jgi:hypothetical protein
MADFLHRVSIKGYKKPSYLFQEQLLVQGFFLVL